MFYVITSYSIHYTKLYELALKLTPRMAVNLHTAISRELESLPDEVAIQYGIQKVETDK